jgi:glycosyltransferase involved in cell wall biosynthesis
LKKTPYKSLIIVFNNLNLGGIENKIIDLCGYYSTQKNLRLVLLLKSKSGPLLSRLPKNIIVKSPCLTDIFKIRTILFPLWLGLNFTTLKPTLIISFGNYSAITSLIAKKLFSSPGKIIVSEDSSIQKEINLATFPNLRRFLVKLTYPWAESIITLSKAGYKNLLNLITRKINITTLPNWLPLSFSLIKNIPKKDIDILFLARFEPQKNPLLFLKISKLLLKKYPHLNIVMVGYGSLENKIKKYISQHKILSSIKIFSQTETPLDFFLRSKLFLMTSIHEGFPLTILESSAALSLPLCPNLKEINNYFDKENSHCIYNSVQDALKNISYLLENHQALSKISKYYQQKTLKNQYLNFQNTINYLNKFL